MYDEIFLRTVEIFGRLFGGFTNKNVANNTFCLDERDCSGN